MTIPMMKEVPPIPKLEYEVISNSDLDKFNNLLNDMVQHDWRVDGNLTLACKSGSSYSNSATWFAQRMVRIK